MTSTSIRKAQLVFDELETSWNDFECHYFDVGIDPTTGKPLWKAKSHVDLDGSAIEINGQWFLWNAKATKVGVPVPKV